MGDFYPPVARGERGLQALPAPPRPDEDERWEYVADHLRAIRGSLAVIAAAAAIQIIGLVCALIVYMTDSSGP